MESTTVSLHACSNGCVHINVGNVTINLAKEDFIEFAKRVGDYALHLNGAKPGLVLEYSRKH